MEAFQNDWASIINAGFSFIWSLAVDYGSNGIVDCWPETNAFTDVAEQSTIDRPSRLNDDSSGCCFNGARSLIVSLYVSLYVEFDFT